MFKQLPLDPANVNALKNICDPYSHAEIPRLSTVEIRLYPIEHQRVFKLIQTRLNCYQGHLSTDGLFFPQHPLLCNNMYAGVLEYQNGTSNTPTCTSLYTHN